MTNTEFVTQEGFGHRFIFSGLYIRAVRHRPGLEMYIYTQPLFLGYAAPVFPPGSPNIFNIAFN